MPVVPKDPEAIELLRRMISGPRALPQYAAIAEQAQSRPETVDLSTVKTLGQPGLLGVHYPLGTSGKGRPEIDIMYPLPRAPGGADPEHRQLLGMPQTPQNPYWLGWYTRTYARPEATLAHELAHFLSQVHGIQDPGTFGDERLAQSATHYPIDPGLLRPAFEQRASRQEPDTPFWALVRRQFAAPPAQTPVEPRRPTPGRRR